MLSLSDPEVLPVAPAAVLAAVLVADVIASAPELTEPLGMGANVAVVLTPVHSVSNLNCRLGRIA
jgi:hypothetical protein